MAPSGLWRTGELAIDDACPSHARAKSQHCHILFLGEKSQFAPKGAHRVVLHENRKMIKIFENRFDRATSPAGNIVGQSAKALLGIDIPRRDDSNSAHFRNHQFINRLFYRKDNLFPRMSDIGRISGCFKKIAIVEKTAFDFRSAEIDPNRFHN